MKTFESFSWLMAGMAFGEGKPLWQSAGMLVLAALLSVWNESETA